MNTAFGQSEDLPLAYLETIEYLELNGQPVKKTTSIDYTDREPTTIMIWSTEAISKGARTVTTIGIVDGDTLNQVSIQHYDSLDNLILEVDSSNNELFTRNEYNYEGSVLINSVKYMNVPSTEGGLGPTTSTTKYFYDDQLLTKSITSKEGKSIISLLSGEDVEKSTTIYHYNQQEQLEKEISKSSSGSTFILTNSYDNRGRKIRTDFNEDGFSTWTYDNRGNLVEEFTQYANFTQRIKYAYDSLNRVTKKLTYLRQ